MAQSILTDKQKVLLSAIAKTDLAKQFYLTGGTALAEFYLHHRYSEDLDFFSEDEVNILTLTTILKQLKKTVGFKTTEMQQSFNRNIVFLNYSNEVIKTEFTYFPFPRVDESARSQEYNIQIDSLIDIAVNKIFTIYQQSRARDYIDLYIICKKENYTIDELVKHAQAKFETHIDLLQLGTQFVKATEVKDYPRMIKETKASTWQKFFLDEAKKLKPEVLE